MKRKLRKTLCGLLAGGLLAGLVPVAAQAASPFTDVSDSAWYAGAVQFVYDCRLMSGVDSRSFQPKAPTSRGQLVSILYRLAGQPAVSGRAPFSDVSPSAYYHDAVVWATDAEIVSGSGKGLFNPQGNVTREQLAVFLYRFSSYQKYGVGNRADLTCYDDEASISDYAYPAVRWAVGAGVMGNAEGWNFAPKAEASRAVLALTLQRLCTLYGIEAPDGTVSSVILPVAPAAPQQPETSYVPVAATVPQATPAQPVTTPTPTPAPAQVIIPAVKVPLSDGSVSAMTLDGSTVSTPRMVFQWPVQGSISSGYGYRYIFGENSFHRGIDIPAPLGVGVHAAAEGTVIFAGDQGSYGNLVILDHGNGFQSYYGHNSRLLVKAGDVVQRNQVVAAIGATGRATGNHCHFEVHYNGQVVDPMKYLPAANNAPANQAV